MVGCLAAPRSRHRRRQAERSEELREYLAGVYREGRDAVARMVRASLGDAEIADHEMPAVTSFLIAVHNGLLLQWLVDPAATPTPAELIEGLGSVLPRALIGDHRPSG